MRSQLLLLLFVETCLASQVRFDHVQVHRLTPWTADQLQNLRQLFENVQELDFWTDVTEIGYDVDIMVPPHLKHNFDDFISLHNFDSQLLIEDVQKLIDNEKSGKQERIGSFGWKKYNTLDEIYSWLRLLSRQYSGIVKLINVGLSYEGRHILGVRVSFKSGNKGVILEGGIHAREWISPATVTYILNELLTSTDPEVRAVAESRDWYVFPVINPDGYVYTHKRDRTWRKTRKPYGECYGADLNRNWGYHWNDGGTSSDPCSIQFAGSKPFSESETKNFAKYISKISSNLDAFITFHSYGQALLIPFGHSGYEVPHNNEELHRIGKNAMKKLSQRYGTQYRTGNIPQVVYVASGSSIDWVFSRNRHIRLVYTFELRDKGEYGFLLPPQQIIPTAEETLDALVSMFQQLDGTVS